MCMRRPGASFSECNKIYPVVRVMKDNSIQRVDNTIYNGITYKIHITFTNICVLGSRLLIMKIEKLHTNTTTHAEVEN